MAAYGLCGKVVAVEGQGEALEGHLLEAARALEAADGCHLYLVSRARDEADAVWVVEVWEDAQAHQASLELPAVQDLIARARPIIAGMPERIEMEPLGGKGLALG